MHLDGPDEDVAVRRLTKQLTLAQVRGDHWHRRVRVLIDERDRYAGALEEIATKTKGPARLIALEALDG